MVKILLLFTKDIRTQAEIDEIGCKAVLPFSALGYKQSQAQILFRMIKVQTLNFYYIIEYIMKNISRRDKSASYFFLTSKK